MQSLPEKTESVGHCSLTAHDNSVAETIVCLVLVCMYDMCLCVMTAE